MITIPLKDNREEVTRYFTEEIGSDVEISFCTFSGGDLDGFQGWYGVNRAAHTSWRLAFGGSHAYVEMVPQREETLAALRFA